MLDPVEVEALFQKEVINQTMISFLSLFLHNITPGCLYCSLLGSISWLKRRFDSVS